MKAKEVRMFGTKYDIKFTQIETPESSWFMANTVRREVWLQSRGYRTIWATHKFGELPQYIRDKWSDEF